MLHMKTGLIALLLLLTGTAGFAQNNNSSTYAWPQLILSGRDSIWVYQPQATQWSNGQLKGSQAVAVHTIGETQERYGVIWFSATGRQNNDGRVYLNNYTVTKQNFPSLTDNGNALVSAIKTNAGSFPGVNKQKIQDDVSLGSKGNPAKGIDAKNDPPQIIHSSDPAILVYVDGKPTFRDVAGTPYKRILNTNYLVLTDGTNYFTPVGDQWATSTSLQTPDWSVAGGNIGALNNAKDVVQSDKSLNLVLPGTDAEEVATALDNGTVPKIYVTEQPSELLLTNGAPDFTPIDGTNLLYAQNARGDIFKDISDNRTYTLISGRWYTATSIDGPWSWVDPQQLPQDFANIPADHPESKVLVSIPNTSQSQEATIANSIPQTASVDVSQATLQTYYDGDPEFKPINNTNLEYAVNASTPVIRYGDRFYACEKAVWFVGGGPMGPWQVARQVPDEIYNIPPSSPVYNVTYVRVYDYTPSTVVVGYTPGYYGWYNSDWGCPIYGTGWWYRPWIGSYWYAPPISYGFGVSFGWNSWYGFGASFNFGFGGDYPFYRPYWGPWAWYHPGYYGGGRLAYINHINVYNNWGRGAVRPFRNPINRVSPAPGRGAGGRVANNPGAYPGGRGGSLYNRPGSDGGRFNNGIGRDAGGRAINNNGGGFNNGGGRVNNNGNNGGGRVNNNGNNGGGFGRSNNNGRVTNSGGNYNNGQSSTGGRSNTQTPTNGGRVQQMPQQQQQQSGRVSTPSNNGGGYSRPSSPAPSRGNFGGSGGGGRMSSPAPSRGGGGGGGGGGGRGRRG